jgi:hypothetical protein
MEEKLKRQLVNLRGFLQFYLEPAGRRMLSWRAALLKDAGLPDRKASLESLPLDRVNYWKFGGQFKHSQLSLWEGYLWLQLGVKIEYFPLREVETVLTESVELFPQYYTAYTSIGDLIPGRLHLALSRAFGFRPTQLFTELGYGKFEHLESLHAVLSALLLTQSAFADDSIAQSTAALLTFDDDSLWQSYMKDQLDEGKLDAAFARWHGENVDVSKELLFAGFFRILSYLGQQKALRRGQDSPSAGPDSSYSPDGMRALLGWAKDISFWRMNFYRRAFKERFLKLTDAAGSFLMSESRRMDLSSSRAQDPNAFRREVTELMDFWSSDVSMDLTRGQGG